MFDGSFRSKREVNLGGSRRGQRQRGQRASSGSSPQDKNAILKNAEILRRQRQEQQRRDRAARLLQRRVRDRERRKRIAVELTAVVSSKAHNSKSGDTQHDNDHIIALSLLLSPTLRPFVVKSQRQLLLEWADSNETTVNDASTKPADRKPQNDSAVWFSLQRIIMATLFEMQSQEVDPMERSSLFSILESYFSYPSSADERPKAADPVPLFLQLMECTRLWISKSLAANASNDLFVVARALCRWSSEMAQRLATNHSLAMVLLSGSFLSIPKLLGPEYAQGFQNILPTQFHSNDMYNTWVSQAALLCDRQDQSIDDSALARATNQLFQQRDIIILENAYDLYFQQSQTVNYKYNYDPRPLIKLLHHIFTKRPDLGLLASLVVQGEDLSAHLATTSTLTLDQGQEIDPDDMDDSDDDETTASAAAAHNEKSRKSTNLTRQDLQTVVKLNKFYQEDVRCFKKFYLEQAKGQERIVTFVNKIRSNPATWLQWGLMVLDDDDDDDDGDQHTHGAADAYVNLLGFLLQSSTGLKPNTKPSSYPFISHLAFDSKFLQLLWKRARREGSSPTALTVFCDVFAHYLIALSDVDFLKHHTVNTTERPSKIIAEEVIVHLRSILYDVYWDNPVVASDIHWDANDGGRGRLLLAATKLWNSLYERWNRLVRTAPFCEESTWWFPHLKSREGEGAVVSSMEQGQVMVDSDDDDDGMDIDNDDDDDENEDSDSAAAMDPADAETDELADSFRDPKMARILTGIPQALPFDRRLKLFHALLSADKKKERAPMPREDDDGFFSMERPWVPVRIHRDNLYHDAMEKLNHLGPTLRRKIKVSLVNQHGAEEAGIDGGGVFKEFLDDLISDGFVASASSDAGQSNNTGKGRTASGNNAPPLFTVTPMQTLAVNPEMTRVDMMLVHYAFLGRVLGKAVYESILVEPQFCLPFLNQLLGKANSLEDLKNFDEEYYKNLNKLRSLSEEDLNRMELTFELTVGSPDSRLAHPRTIELIRGGRTCFVTKQNVIQYVHLVSHYLLNIQGSEQTRAFLRGFRDLIPASWVRLFSANELQKLIGGDDSIRGIDVASLKRATVYSAGYHPSQRIIQDFWHILQYDFTPDQQRKFLKFMTSCSRQPLLGFQSMQPAPCIQQIRLRDDENTQNSRLPTSSTCMNLLKLPNYRDKSLMKEKLLAAIEAGAGFELT